MRQNVKRRERNRIVRGSVRAALRAFRGKDTLDAAIERLSWKIASKDKKELAQKAGAKMYSVVDKALKKGIIHRNKAARHKSQISKWITRMSA